jgi:glycerophosphoryl diester phosphodiesterase
VSFSDPVLVIGHRGAAGLCHENTLPSFRRAWALGVHAIELDVHLADGELVVIHDDTLDRTTGASGALGARSLTELRSVDAGGGWPIPLLREVVAELPATVGLNVELKGAGTAAPAAAYLGGLAGVDLLVSSFDHAELARFHRLAPNIAVAPLFDRWSDDAWSVAERLDAWGVNVARRIATVDLLAEAARCGLPVLVYTVNEAAAARRLFELGARGVFTDYPDRIIPVVPADPAPVRGGNDRR